MANFKALKDTPNKEEKETNETDGRKKRFQNSLPPMLHKPKPRTN